MKNTNKNILDLKHSINLAKAASFLGLAFSSWIALFFGMREFYDNPKIIIFIATLTSAFFLYSSIIFFNKCKDIHKEIKDMK